MPYRKWQNLTDDDFRSLGFMCGLETHHQLLTDGKLFCRCPAIKKYTRPEAEILRHMRPTLSELGEYDGAALMEFKTKKNVIYQLYTDAVCTYEMDDTPPFHVDEQAVDISIILSLMLDCSIVDEVHISRKQYLDGSIPTGFQRTAIIGVDGQFPLGIDDRIIRVVQTSLEEDSCREISDIGHTITFRTDRLSWPLIEFVTHPDMKTPTEAGLAAKQVGRIFRASQLVRRGMGSARQDVNVSIAGGTRVEIKGVPRIPDIPALTYNEALRQKALLEIRDECAKNGITPETLEAGWKTADVSDKVIGKVTMNAPSSVLRSEIVKACRVIGFRDFVSRQTQPEITFASELSGRIRVIACIDRLPNISHEGHTIKENTLTNRPTAFGNTTVAAHDMLPESVWHNLRTELECGENDALILTWGPSDDVETAVREILARCKEATEGVPNETRQAFWDGTTDFERILPGADRMYPDTDSPPIAITEEQLERMQSRMPERPWERETRYRELGIHNEIGRELAIHPLGKLFDRLISENQGIDPVMVAVTLTQTMKSLSRSGYYAEEIDEEKIFKAIKGVQHNLYTSDALPDILAYMAENPDKKYSAAIDELKIERFDEKTTGNTISGILNDAEIPEISDSTKKTRYIAGLIMDKCRGRAKWEEVERELSQMAR
ncbi:MAG TPA: Glu-tRNA(Gln) amidotransferase subunit GatE [bacterium]|jgi:glutamyl-tRNA(Gln) amidotransferase subunit E